jgi:hypothetical protein
VLPIKFVKLLASQVMPLTQSAEVDASLLSCRRDAVFVGTPTICLGEPQCVHRMFMIPVPALATRAVPVTAAGTLTPSSIRPHVPTPMIV